MRRYSILLLALLLVAGCKSADKVNYSSDQEIFLNALKLFKEKKYDDAYSLLDVIALQYPASQYADDAQYYTAEINYAKEEYIIAAFQYNKLLRNYSASDYSKISMYKVGLCYYQLSPPYDRDQDYTQKAINSFQEFLTLYPDDSLATDANKKIQELRNKLAHRQYFTGQIYLRLSSPLSALIYFDEVINNYPDTEYFEKAFFNKIQTLYNIKHYEELKSLIPVFKNLFPNSPDIAKVDEISNNIR
ncbi:MAG TPA: outer membrane protein assembly factor BamD [Candidatus Kapabacteria bacterium]|nr:outer membrane protein assembly factor BamD [Candidatus Kapabacteria bacterium]HOV93172.1 outer membrane protein assembly factor BamD [Candidatus Kapabacteria bacterium]